eukprot:gnl/TRDRNA2_/TRDRNA2_190239_c0_seq1.p1 gnl/TRDRNA2_/TRDRNA2_190239_c0~~gnl/TRDRNA2_/TRDRNA2_190239_c0_seq1.p1  ORF type:complete len:190 (+),score=28.08 gnl/TRDRNA2_/TRDRNA2_190239_c0_seq1:99-668(+)
MSVTAADIQHMSSVRTMASSPHEEVFQNAPGVVKQSSIQSMASSLCDEAANKARRLEEMKHHTMKKASQFDTLDAMQKYVFDPTARFAVYLFSPDDQDADSQFASGNGAHDRRNKNIHHRKSGRHAGSETNMVNADPTGTNSLRLGSMFDAFHSPSDFSEARRKLVSYDHEDVLTLPNIEGEYRPRRSW